MSGGRSRVEKPCAQCGTPFRPHSGHEAQRYCSLACKGQAQRTVDYDLVRRLYGTRPSRALARELGVPQSTLTHLAIKLGVAKRRSQAWSEEDFAMLRRLYPTTPVQELSGLMGRTRASIAEKASVLGLRKPDMPTFWTPEQDAEVRACYGKEPTEDLARRLRKSPGAVRQRGYKLGVDASQALPPAELDRIRELNGEGLSDREIGELLGRPQRTIWRLRTEMGLPRRGRRLGETGALSPRHRERLRAAQQARAAADPEGLRKKLRKAQYRFRAQFADRHGWPGVLAPVSVLALNVLARAGVPLTAVQIYDALHPNAREEAGGARRRADLRTLLEAGLVLAVRIPCLGHRSAEYRSGTYRTTTVAYTLSPLALSILREHAQCKSNDETPR
jgi:hypothetical protein